MEELKNEIKKTYLEFYHGATDEGVTALIDAWKTNKHDLIEKFKAHPNYNGNYQIVIDEPFEVKIDSRLVREKCNTFLETIHARNKVVKMVNADGKSFTDMVVDSFKTTPYFTTLDKLDELKPVTQTITDEFNGDGEWRESVKKFVILRNAIDYFRGYSKAIIDADFAQYLNEQFPKVTDANGKVIEHCINIGEGMKTSRALNKVFARYGFDRKDFYGDGKVNLYLKHFPEYADLVKEGYVNRKMVISINPLDYLKMSFGNTWASCHTIDKNNVRHMPNNYSGMYCGGTLSYMLDPSSIVVYVVPENADINHPDRTDKIYRNMFHYENNVLVQGRVYPQSNDGALDLYKKFRLVVQREICKMLNLDYIDTGIGTDTWIKKGSSTEHSSQYIESSGVHYRDYTNFSNCNISYLRNNETGIVHIGHDGICAKCGRPISAQDKLTHSNCLQ